MTAVVGYCGNMLPSIFSDISSYPKALKIDLIHPIVSRKFQSNTAKVSKKVTLASVLTVFSYSGGSRAADQMMKRSQVKVSVERCLENGVR